MHLIRESLLIFSGVLLLGCGGGIPSKDSPERSATLRSFFVGTAAMQASDDIRARTELENAVRLSPGEPAAYANLGILDLRQKDLVAARRNLERALSLSPDNGQMLRNLYILESTAGDFERASKHLESAIALDPNDVRSINALAREYERENRIEEAEAAYRRLLELRPQNLPTQLDAVRLAVRRGDEQAVNFAIEKIAARREEWDSGINEQFDALKTSAARRDLHSVSQNISFLRNALLRLSQFRNEIADVRFNDNIIGEPFYKPLKMEVPLSPVAPPDRNLKFEAVASNPAKASWVDAVFLDGDLPPVAAWADDTAVYISDRSIPFEGASAIRTVDIDYDFKNDFVIAGRSGVRFYQSDLVDMTGRTKISDAVQNAAYTGVFLFDLEIDGDLDVVLGRAELPPLILRNNADGTFETKTAFDELVGLSLFTAADLDEDGDMDVAAADANGKLFIFANERAGQFHSRNSPITTTVNSLAVADLNGDARLELILVTGGSLIRVSDADSGRNWLIEEVPNISIGDGNRLIVGDLDNNGAIDIVAGSDVFLSDTAHHLNKTEITLKGPMSAVADLDGDGRLDLLGSDENRRAAIFINSGEKNYGWQIIRPRSAKAEGDQRVNSFGIGAEAELRAGMLAQKRVVDSPQVHFGLGHESASDLLRIIWGNGFLQAEFDLESNHQVLVRQRLTGSCPHLFAWNGSGFKLVKDGPPLGTSLGLRISDARVVPVTQTEEWYKVSGDQLVPKNGRYEIRITDELWETYYVDRYALVAVDHPLDTEVFVNEIYPIPAVLAMDLTGKPRPFASVRDESGRDVSKIVKEIDQSYLDSFEKGRFQGVAKEHFAEVELPADHLLDKQILMIADGWLHPTDTSLNVAISQGSYDKPQSLRLDVLSENGTWRTLADDLGVPAGKLKTLVIDLPVGTRRARLRTNMEIYWDRLAWAVKERKSEYEIQPISLIRAEIGHRGFSVIEKRDDNSPELPDYERISTTIQRWRSIEGYYTRYGDIKELIAAKDDRYAIAASGDEIILSFEELPAVRAGWKRDFVFVGVGWIKEGDHNNVFSRTVLPLPSHKSNDYARKPTILEDDPVYRRHRPDWQRFHTRYVAPDDFRNAVRTR